MKQKIFLLRKKYTMKDISGIQASFTALCEAGSFACKQQIVVSQLYQFAKAVITGTTNWMAQNNTHLLSHCSKGQNSEIKVSIGPLSLWNMQGKDPFLPHLASAGCWQLYVFFGLWTHHFNLPSSHGHLPTVHISFCVKIFIFIRTSVTLDSGSP